MTGSNPYADVKSMSERFGLSQTDIKSFLDGKVVTQELDATTDKDLSLLCVAQVNASIEECWEFSNLNKVVDIQAATLEAGDIIMDSEDPLGAMTLEDQALSKLEKDPSGLYFLSKAEAKVMSHHKKSHKSAMECLREVLMGRVKSYYENGLDGIAPYNDDKKRNPKIDLEHANQAVWNRLKDKVFQDELTVIPSKVMDPTQATSTRTIKDANGSDIEINHTLGWSIQKGRDLACPTLCHYIRIKAPEGYLSVTRRFYSGYDYDSTQIISGVLPVDAAKSICFYTNHTYTKQVAGFGGSAKRSIGRKMMVGKLVETMQRAQKEIGK